MGRKTADRRRLLTVLLAGLVVTAAGCFAPPPPPPATSVKWLVYGDSLSQEARSYLEARGTVGARFFGGTAPCNWVDGLTSDAAAFAPEEVLLQFIGNIPACINGRDPKTAYEQDLTTIANFWKGRGVSVAMVISPKTPMDDLAWARQAELAVAAKLGLALRDAGQAVMLNGDFTYFLPCLPQEAVGQGCGTEVEGQIRVRDANGVHFGTANPARSYSSGAYRFALAESQA